MSDLIQMEMTLDEARETDRLIKRHINHTRYLLLDMRDRKGWKALGYESFVEYGKKSLGYDKSHIYELADAGEIGLQVGFSEISENQPKESHLKPLKSIPEAERKAIWEEATRKAEEENAKLTAKRVEEEVAEWKRRNEEWATQNKADRDKLKSLELELTTVKNQPVPKPVVIEKEVIPDDYEDAKAQAAQLATVKADLDKLKKEQAKIIDQQVKAKLQGYQSQVDKLEAQKKTIEDIVARKKAYLDSLDSEVKRLAVHKEVIDESRLSLISLAGFLNDLDPVSDPATIKRWLALGEMHKNAWETIRYVFGERHESASGICHD